MISRSYTYTAHAILDVAAAPTAAPTPTGQGPNAFRFTSDIAGEVQDGVKIHATITNTDGANSITYQAIQIGDDGYLNLGSSSGWTKSDTRVRGIPLTYRPDNICQAITPDIDTTKMDAPSSEQVNGVDSDHYKLSNFPAEFFARSADFTGSSDAYEFIKSLEGDIWLAKDGRWPTRLSIAGAGAYPNGAIYTVTLSLEIANMGGKDIKVSPPDFIGTPSPGPQ